jgi:hypothetical protein
MRLQAIHGGAEAQRVAHEPPPYGADWPEVAYEADVILPTFRSRTKRARNSTSPGPECRESARGSCSRGRQRDVMTLDEFFAGQEPSGAVFEPLSGAVAAVWAAELRVTRS